MRGEGEGSCAGGMAGASADAAVEGVGEDCG